MVKKLTHILRNQEDATFFVNTPRVGYFKRRTFKKFVECFDRNEATKMEAERISPDATNVKIWIRGYGNTSYMLETSRENVLINIPTA